MGSTHQTPASPASQCSTWVCRVISSPTMVPGQMSGSWRAKASCAATSASVKRLPSLLRWWATLRNLGITSAAATDFTVRMRRSSSALTSVSRVST